MAYNLYKTNGIKLVTIEDGSIDKSATALTLVGKNYSGYGQSINQNLIKLVENFAFNTQPTASLTGQLWYDTGTKSLKVYNGTRYRPLAAIDSNANSPTDSIKGDLWFNESDQKLYYYNGLRFLLVGPQFTGLASNNLVTPKSVVDTIGTTHYILEHQLQIGSINSSTSVVAITSAEEFALSSASAISGFTQIKSGITLYGADPTTGVSSVGTTGHTLLWGTAADSLKLNGQPASSYVLQSSPNFSTQISVSSNAGITIGGGAFNLYVTAPAGVKEANVSAPQGNVIKFNVLSSGNLVNALNIDSASGLAILPTTDVGQTTNIGSSGNRFATGYVNNVVSKTVSASVAMTTGCYNSNAEREAAIPTPVRGMIILNGTKFQGYDGADWLDLN